MKKFIGHILYFAFGIGMFWVTTLLGDHTDMPIWHSNAAYTIVLLTFVISIANSIFAVLCEVPPNCAFIVKVVSFVAVLVCVIAHNKLKGGIWFNGGTTTWEYIKQWTLWVAIEVYVANCILSAEAVKEKIG